MLVTPADLVLKIARLGRQHPAIPPLAEVEIFDSYFVGPDRVLDRSGLNKRDGCCTRREVLTRFLLLMAILDQGPDIVGLRQMLVAMTNALYRREIRFLHRPADLFREIGIAVNQLLTSHDSIKSARADVWARETQSTPTRYNLLQYDNNQTKPLHYMVARWGVPLLLPLFLADDPAPLFDFQRADNPTVLLDYLERWESAEQMSRQIKSHDRYGLGKAIGDKATHLFTKWFVSTFRLGRRYDEKAWGEFSYEVPYDSNAGRVLWRTGYLLYWAGEGDYIRHQVLQPGLGKGGTTYIRVTNIRKMGATRAVSPAERDVYTEVVQRYLRISKTRPRKGSYPRNRDRMRS